mgnify:CR=1 FL=1
MGMARKELLEFYRREKLYMSIYVGHLTNGEKELYVVTHTDTGKMEFYNTKVS